MKKMLSALSVLFSRWFHKRNIIIVSERKVKHIPISGHLQFIALIAAICGVSWASYSTGSFMAARSALKEQGQALRTVTNAHIESSFKSNYKASAADKSAMDVGPYRRSTPSVALDGPIAALSVLDKAKLVARITALESKVIELKTTNEAIVQRVQDKTAGKLDELEGIVKHTGLKLSELKKQLNTSVKTREAHVASEGGPYIPAETSVFTPQTREMFSSLDDLTVLSQIVNNLPLARPIRNAEEQSTFGRRVDPFNGHLAFHSGIDLSGPAGSKVYSTADGKIVSAGRNGAYGNSIDIEHGFGIVTRYAHLSEVLVQDGQTVKKGDVIGVQGSTGRSTGAHLHYEVRYHDQPMNPKNFLEAVRYVSKE